jgi:hypothetical protein
LFYEAKLIKNSSTSINPKENSVATVTNNHSKYKELIDAMSINYHTRTIEQRAPTSFLLPGHHNSSRSASDVAESRDDEPITCNGPILTQCEPCDSPENCFNSIVLVINSDGTVENGVVTTINGTYLQSSIAPVSPLRVKRSESLYGTSCSNDELPRTKNAISKASQGAWIRPR